MIYPSTSKGPYKVAGVIDPNEKRLIGVIYKPDAWSQNTVYYVRGVDDYDIVLPSTANGFYYKATNPGKSGTVEPTWPTTVGEAVSDGSVVWEAVAYNLLPLTDSISTSTFTASDGVVLANPVLTVGKTSVLISSIPAGVAQFTVTNHTIRASGEECDVTLLFKVASR